MIPLKLKIVFDGLLVLTLIPWAKSPKKQSVRVCF